MNEQRLSILDITATVTLGDALLVMGCCVVLGMAIGMLISSLR